MSSAALEMQLSSPFSASDSRSVTCKPSILAVYHAFMCAPTIRGATNHHEHMKLRGSLATIVHTWTFKGTSPLSHELKHGGVCLSR